MSDDKRGVQLALLQWAVGNDATKVSAKGGLLIDVGHVCMTNPRIATCTNRFPQAAFFCPIP